MRRPAPALSVATCGFHVYLVEGPLLSVLPPTGPGVRGRPPPRGAAARTAAHPAGARKCHDAVAVHLHADRVRLSRAPRFRLGAVRAPGVPRGCWPWAPGVTRRKASFLARSSADVHPPVHTHLFGACGLRSRLHSPGRTSGGKSPRGTTVPGGDALEGPVAGNRPAARLCPGVAHARPHQSGALGRPRRTRRRPRGVLRCGPLRPRAIPLRPWVRVTSLKCPREHSSPGGTWTWARP